MIGTRNLSLQYMELRMSKHIALGAVLALGLTSHVMAAESFSYSNVDLAYGSSKLSNLDGGEGSLDVKGDGFSLSGSAAFNDTIFGFVSFGTLTLDKFKLDGVSVDSGGIDMKLKPLTVGVGFHLPLGPSVDFVAGASFERLKVSAADLGLSASANGYGVSAGLRGRLGSNVELNGALKYIDIEGSELVYNVGGRYYFTKAFAAGFEFTKYDDTNLSVIGISLRYDFGG
jgi:hypothetical protein